MLNTTSGATHSGGLQLVTTSKSTPAMSPQMLMDLISVLDQNPEIVLAHLDEIYSLFLKLRVTSKALFLKVHQCFGIKFARFAYKFQGYNFTFKNKAQSTFKSSISCLYEGQEGEEQCRSI
jgi:hypothetical protein